MIRIPAGRESMSRYMEPEKKQRIRILLPIAVGSLIGSLSSILWSDAPRTRHIVGGIGAAFAVVGAAPLIRRLIRRRFGEDSQ